MSIPRPFTIQVPDEVLADLRMRLERLRWPDENPGSGWQYGSDLVYMNALVTYWREKYDWRAHEARLNRLRQFAVPIDGIDLHFIHEPGVGPDPLPLLLSHGWPGSIVEFERLIPLLTDPARFGGDPVDAFTVVAPSPTSPRNSVRRTRTTYSASTPRCCRDHARSRPRRRRTTNEHTSPSCGIGCTTRQALHPVSWTPSTTRLCDQRLGLSPLMNSIGV